MGARSRRSINTEVQRVHNQDAEVKLLRVQFCLLEQHLRQPQSLQPGQSAALLDTPPAPWPGAASADSTACKISKSLQPTGSAFEQPGAVAGTSALALGNCFQ